MSSDTADKKNEEPGEDVSGSSKKTEQEQPTDAHAEASCSVPLEESNSVASDNGNPLAETKTVSDVNNFKSQSTPQQDLPPCLFLDAGAVTGSAEPDIQPPAHIEAKAHEVPETKEDAGVEIDQAVSVKPKPTAASRLEVPTDSTADAPADSTAEPPAASKVEAPSSSRAEAPADSTAEPPAASKVEVPSSSRAEAPADSKVKPSSEAQPTTPKLTAASSDIKLKGVNVGELKNHGKKTEFAAPATNEKSNMGQLFLLDGDYEGSESGTEEEQSAFMKELENFFREKSMEFKPPKFYGEGLNCLKLWRAVTRLGGYDKVTSCKLWRQVGESFKPPKTCTTVSWTFRGFYEKALLDYERHKISGGELSLPVASHSEPMNIDNQASGSGRTRRDAATRAMQGWHSQRVLDNGEVTDPIIKDKNSQSLQKSEKQLGLLKRKKTSYVEHAVKAARTKTSKSQLDVDVVDVGPPADWVKINVQRSKDCFEVYALVPGLLREEVRVQSDPVGRLVISGEPEHPDNPWGVTPFKKVVSLPSRIDPHQTSAVVTLHGQLFVRVPFEQSDQ